MKRKVIALWATTYMWAEGKLPPWVARRKWLVVLALVFLVSPLEEIVVIGGASWIVKALIALL